MARSPFTLVAAVTAAVPGAEVTGARALTADGDGRFDSAVATLADGSELVIRVASDDAAALELAEEALALRALTPKDLQRVARKYFDPRKRTRVTVLPPEEVPA